MNWWTENCLVSRLLFTRNKEAFKVFWAYLKQVRAYCWETDLNEKNRRYLRLNFTLYVFSQISTNLLLNGAGISGLDRPFFSFAHFLISLAYKTSTTLRSAQNWWYLLIKLRIYRKICLLKMNFRQQSDLESQKKHTFGRVVRSTSCNLTLRKRC